VIALADLLRGFSPGSHGEGWTWDDEAADLLSADCYCTSAPEGYTGVVVVGDPCGTPGHYQLRLEEHLREVGRIEQPICLGDDGRVWDGHHRVVAAVRLGFDRLPVED
jgi:hypothetical protein